MAKKQVIIESIRYGAYMKVIAIDPESGVEVSIVGDPSAGQEALSKLAAKKLNYVLSKRKN